MYELKLSDLRSLAILGNATVKLDAAYNFEIAQIRRDGIYVPERNAYINGKRTEIKMQVSFAHAYSHIQTVKQGKRLVAERRKDKLVATTLFEKELETKKESKEK